MVASPKRAGVPGGAPPTTMKLDDDSYLPEIDVNQLVVWNQKRRKCCGFLNKKGGSSGAGGIFGNRRNWQKRFFVLEHRISSDDNYLLRYFKNPDDKEPKGVLPLDGAEVVEDSDKTKSKKDQQFAFQVKVPERKDLFEVTATSEREKQMWVQTLKYVISIASRRGSLMRQRMGQRMNARASFYVEEDEPDSPQRKHNKHLGPKRPQIRLEIDINNMLPGSAERGRFISSFQEDLGSCLLQNPGAGSSLIRIFELKPAAGMDWLTCVEFDIVPDAHEEDDEDAQADIKAELLVKLDSLVRNTSSDLYLGMVTCQVDSSYLAILAPSQDETERLDVPPHRRPIATPVPRVKTILEKYMSVELPQDAHDASKFHVYLRFEQKKHILWVPSPRTLPRKSCVMWEHEVKDCLGLSGTVQDLWMTPVALNPSGVPTSLAAPLHFTSSAKHGGINIIDTSLCRQGVTYDVIFDDRRMEAIEDLAPEQKEEIMETFNRYDINGDGDIDRGECVAACKDRSAIAKEAIDKQFEAAIQDAESQEKVAELESQKQGHYMKVDEAESQLMNMFEKADSDGDGSLSQHEFFLAEAWWMKSTLNPTKVSLF